MTTIFWSAIFIFVIFICLRMAVRTEKIELISRIENLGFGHREESVTLITKDGSKIETTLGEIEKRVKEINDKRYWINRKFDIVLGFIYCSLSIAATFFVYMITA